MSAMKNQVETKQEKDVFEMGLRCLCCGAFADLKGR